MPVVGGTSRDNFVLTRGETREIGPYRVEYAGREKTPEGFDRYVLNLQDGDRRFTLKPVVYQNPRGQWIQHPDVRAFAEQDVYAAVTPAAMFELPDTARKGGQVDDIARRMDELTDAPSLSDQPFHAEIEMQRAVIARANDLAASSAAHGLNGTPVPDAFAQPTAPETNTTSPSFSAATFSRPT